MIHKVEVKQTQDGKYSVKVDEKAVSARSVDIHMDVESMPGIDIGLVGEPDLEVEGLVTFEYTPKTIHGAVKLLKAALLKDNFEAFMGLDSLNRAVAKGK